MGYYERIDARGVRETGRPVSFVPKGALIHHLQNRRRYACGIVRSPRGIAAVATASRQCHSTCECCCHRLRRRQIPCDKHRELGVEILYPCCRLPTQTCHRQL